MGYLSIIEYYSFFIWTLGQKSLKKIRWYFGRNDDTKKSFWN